MDHALDRIIGVGSSTNGAEAKEFLPANTWQGSKPGYYFGTSDQGTGYYLDSKQSTAAASVSNKKRKRTITINEDRNQVQSIPSRHAITADELLEEAEQSHKDEKVLDWTKGISHAFSSLKKLVHQNALLRAQHADAPRDYMESELALHQHIQAMSGLVGTNEQLLADITQDRVALVAQILTHENQDICIAMMHVVVEWLDTEDVNDESSVVDVIVGLARLVVQEEVVSLMIANLARLKSSNEEEDEEELQGVEDVLTTVEELLELELLAGSPILEKNQSVAAYLAKETTLLSWLVTQLPQRHVRAAEILALLLQQAPVHEFVKDWTALPPYTSVLQEDDDSKKPTDVNALEIMLQAMAMFRKTQPEDATSTAFLENVVLSLASALTFTKSLVSQFLEAQGIELVLRCLKEQVHAGGVGLALLDVRHSRAFQESLVTAGGLVVLFKLLQGRKMPQSSTATSKKAKRTWRSKVQSHVVMILYNLSRHLTSSSPQDAQQRLLVKCIHVDVLDRLVELLLLYDEKARKAEYNHYLTTDDDDDDVQALAAKLAGGGDLFHRVGALLAFASVHSKKAHAHVLEQLTLQQSGIGLVKTAVHEFQSLLSEDDETQKRQLQEYLKGL